MNRQNPQKRQKLVVGDAGNLRADNRACLLIEVVTIPVWMFCRQFVHLIVVLACDHREAVSYLLPLGWTHIPIEPSKPVIELTAVAGISGHVICHPARPAPGILSDWFMSVGRFFPEGE
jgi:hypothetical protein